MLLLLFNGLVFILIGLQLASIREMTADVSWSALARYGAVISGVTILVRLIYVPIGTYLPRLLSRSLRAARSLSRLAERDAHRLDGDARHRVAGAGAGAAGDAARRAPFPHRATVIVVAFAVILVTLLLQGLTLPWLIRALKVKDDGDQPARGARGAAARQRGGGQAARARSTTRRSSTRSSWSA